jgi:iron complex outermembrane receptor protein
MTKEKYSIIFSLIRYVAFCCVTCVIKNAAFAEDSAYKLPAISVSAAPIETPLLTVPISASVIQHEDIQERSQDNLQQTIDYIPSLNFSGGTSRPRFFQIRGIGELEQYSGAPNPSVGYILDGLDLSGLGAGSSLFDIDQIEVLRGPQGTKFGSSALAGVINQVSTEPTKDYEGKFQITGGTDELRSGGAAIGGAVPGTDDKVLFRLSVFKLNSDGFRENIFLDRDDTNHRDELTTRGKLKIIPNEWLEINAMATWIDFDNGYDAFAIDNSFSTQSDRPGMDEQGTFGSVLNTKSRLPNNLEFITNTSISNSNNDYGFDGDWGNPQFWEPNNPYDFRYDSFRRRTTFTQEFRLGSDDTDYVHGENKRYFVGIFGQRLAERTLIDQFAEEQLYDSVTSDYNGKTYALFSQLEIPIVRGISISGGIRGEQREMAFQDTRDSDFSPINRMWGGHLTLGADLNDTTYSYVQVSRGFKGGGFNTGPNVPDTNREYAPESLWNVEAGVKTELIEKRLRLNTSVFSMLRRDQQVKFGFQADPNDPLTFTYISDNAARGSNYGLESELTAIVNSNVEFFLSGSLLRSRFDDYTGLGQDLSGRQQSHAPPWQFATGSRIRFENFFVRGDIIGKSSFYFDDVNDQKSQAYSLINLTFGYEQPDWSIQMWARNLFDQRYAVRGFYFGNEPPDFQNKLYTQRGDPLQIGLTFNYHFAFHKCVGLRR